MSTPAQNIMDVNTSASTAAFRAKSASDKVLSYMWYIHVLVSVNTEDRLRAKTALILDHAISSVSSVPATPERTFIDQPNELDRQGEQQPFRGLTDHLILWMFSHDILARLVDTAPVFAQANGYARILADVPVSFREEFCRRLYTLLFSKRIVEWPQGIDVPEPAIAAAKPVVVLDVPVEFDDTHLSPKHEHQETDSAGFDGVMEDKDEDFASQSSSFRPATSIWLQTPSLNSRNGDEFAHMERAAYFGTVSNPLPMSYFADWKWSHNDGGSQSSIDEHKVFGKPLKAFSPSPEKQDRKLSSELKTPLCDTNHYDPPPIPDARRQGREKPSVMYGDGIRSHYGEVSRSSPSIITDTGAHRFDRGRMGTGHSVSTQPIARDEQRNWGVEARLGESTGGRHL